MFRKPPYYLTAYGLAVREGFKGTLEQWLESLRGEKGDGVELRYQDDKLQWRSVPPEGAQIPEDWEEDEWKDLLELEDIRGPVVEQTLEQAQQAAQEATEAAGEAELMASHAQGHEQMAAQYAQEALEAARFVAVTTEYAVSEDGSTPPEVWETDIPELTAEKPFLWMKVNKNYTDGTAAADVGVIGRYSADGKDGSSTTITLKYGVSSTPSMNTITGWQDTIPQMSETYPYLWIEISTETTTATGGSSTIEAGIIGYYSTPDSGGNADQGGLSTKASELLITILRNGVYNVDQSDNITALATELGVTEEEEPDTPVEPDEPEVTLESISTVYSGGDVAVGTTVADLTGIVVTAHYSDGSSETVTGYTLSGSIAEGSNTVTVSYGGKTTTFTVTGMAESGGGESHEGVSSINWLLKNNSYGTDNVTDAWNAIGSNTTGIPSEPDNGYCVCTPAASGLATCSDASVFVCWPLISGKTYNITLANAKSDALYFNLFAAKFSEIPVKGEISTVNGERTKDIQAYLSVSSGGTKSYTYTPGDGEWLCIKCLFANYMTITAEVTE